MNYAEFYQRSIDDPQGFWGGEAERPRSVETGGARGR